MDERFVIRAKLGSETAFERAYGPEGDWVRLFEQGQQFCVAVFAEHKAPWQAYDLRNDIRSRWPKRLPHVQFASIRPDPSLAARVRAIVPTETRTTVILCEREAEKARAVRLREALPTRVLMRFVLLRRHRIRQRSRRERY